MIKLKLQEEKHKIHKVTNTLSVCEQRLWIKHKKAEAKGMNWSIEGALAANLQGKLQKALADF